VSIGSAAGGRNTIYRQGEVSKSWRARPIFRAGIVHVDAAAVAAISTTSRIGAGVFLAAAVEVTPIPSPKSSPPPPAAAAAAVDLTRFPLRQERSARRAYRTRVGVSVDGGDAEVGTPMTVAMRRSKVGNLRHVYTDKVFRY